MELKICHLYPDVLNLYGDRGNILCLQKRLKWRGIGCRVDAVGLGARADLSSYDILFIGGGQDFDQEVLLGDLRAKKGAQIRAALEDGRVFLCICGGYQMMGHYYETADGNRCEFLGAVDFYTVGGRKRMIGNYAFRLGEESGGSTVVGFENHSGRTWLGSGVRPLGTVLKGFGNNGKDGTEGVRYKNAFCTYSHGPVLPKNPALADLLLETAIERKYGKSLPGTEPEPKRGRGMLEGSDFIINGRSKGEDPVQIGKKETGDSVRAGRRRKGKDPVQIGKKETGGGLLAPLPDSFERRAHKTMLERMGIQ